MKHPARRAIHRFLEARSSAGRDRSGTFAVEGRRLVERALRAGVELEAVLFADACARPDADSRDRALLDALEATSCERHRLDDDDAARLSDGRSFGPWFALVRKPAPIELSALVARTPEAILLAAVDVDDEGNAGALVRTALASGADALAVAGTTDPFHPKAVRTSMGSLFKLPLTHFGDGLELTRACRAARVSTVAAVSRGGVPLNEVALADRPLALLVGSEAFGLRDDVRAECDLAVTIPMRDDVDSLSVNAAAAVLLYVARSGR